MENAEAHLVLWAANREEKVVGFGPSAQRGHGTRHVKSGTAPVSITVRLRVRFVGCS